MIRKPLGRGLGALIDSTEYGEANGAPACCVVRVACA